MRSEIWLGDLVRASAALAPTAGELADIAGLLGLGSSGRNRPSAGEVASAPTVQGSIMDNEVVSAGTDTVGKDTVDDTAPAQESSDSDGEAEHCYAVPTTPAVISTDSDTSRPEPGPEGDPWAGVEPVPAFGPHHLTTRPPHQPLLPPQSARAILQTMLCRRVPDGPIDVPALVDVLARCRPVHELPREPVATLRFGVQVLVDVGSAMEPFARDQLELVDEVRRLVGRDATDVQYFADNPQRGCGTGPRWTWGHYFPPAPGSRVLLLSDLGLGRRMDHRRASRTEWEVFISRTRWHGCAPVALVPLPASRWPSWLTALLPLVSWDRSTTVGHARARSTWT